MKKLVVFVAMMVVWQWAFTASAAQETQTKFPIVLIHGFFGFGDGMSWLMQYFGEIPELLRYHGATVYIADLSQANTIETRGEELYRQLLDWGHQKYNLIGHSHGGLDARYVLEVHPSVVASVTTIGSPHRGTPVADYIWDTMARHSLARLFLLNLGELLGLTIGFLSGTFHAQDIERSLMGLTTQGLLFFNETHSVGLSDEYCAEGPSVVNGRKLYSWGSANFDQQPHRDLLKRIFRITERAFWQDEINDGLVSLCSMKFGTWLGAEEGHHLVPVGGIVGSISEDQKMWVREMFYDHARRLRKEGL